MSTTKLMILGLLAGSTIFLGLPVARMVRPLPRARALLNAIAAGILFFLLFDVLAHANEPVEAALVSAHDGSGTWLRFAGLATVFGVGLAVGLLSLVAYERWPRHGVRPAGPGAALAGTLRARTAVITSEAQRVALFIALGIGLHNFSEGLAIGQSAGRGDINLAGVLIVGFALHNGTEGFGIAAPFANSGERPTWARLALLGVIGGGPTFLGTVLGRSFVNDTVFLAFLALAAGSIIYVIVQLLRMAERLKQTEMLMWGLVAGIAIGFATDYVLVAAGA